jgi:aspartate/methionine/tyrosine aminotransferase
MTHHTAARVAEIQPFYVMEILARARELEAGGRSIIHMEIGEPDFVTPRPIIDAGKRAMDMGYTHYTSALGLGALREAIAADYAARYQVSVSPARIIITPGASGALLLAMALLVDPRSRVLLADPGYPCNRHFVRLMEGEAVGIPVDAATNYQLTPELIRVHGTPSATAVLIASPSNPTGAVATVEQLNGIADCTRRLGAALIVDEIYHGLTYAGTAPSVLNVTDDVFVINSFSKYYGMTGWRLGWMVVPQRYIAAVDKLAQNIFLAAPTIAQYAALAAFDAKTTAILEQRRGEFMARRDYLLPALRDLGFHFPATPQGAFYLYAGCDGFSLDSRAFAADVLECTGVAFTPGADFGTHQAQQHVRFAYTTSRENLEEGVKRLKKYLGV